MAVPSQHIPTISLTFSHISHMICNQIRSQIQGEDPSSQQVPARLYPPTFFCMQHVSSFLNVSSFTVCVCACVGVTACVCVCVGVAFGHNYSSSTFAAPHFSSTFFFFANCVPYAVSYVNETKTWKQESEDRKCSYIHI